MTEDEIVGWHHRSNGHELVQTPGNGGGLTARPGMLQSMGSQRVGHDLVTKQQEAHIHNPTWGSGSLALTFSNTEEANFWTPITDYSEPLLPLRMKRYLGPKWLLSLLSSPRKPCCLFSRVESSLLGVIDLLGKTIRTGQGFPWHPGIKTPPFHRRGHNLNPSWGTKIPDAVWYSQK